MRINTKKIVGVCAVAGMLAGLSTPASAAYISDSWEDYVPLYTDLEDGSLFSEAFDNLTWTHNFWDNGYTPLIDQLTDGWVQIELRNFSTGDSAEVRFSLLGLGGGGGGGTFNSNLGTFNLTAEGLSTIWLTGIITANLEPVSGSFYAVGSLAHLDGLRWVDGYDRASVPEPGPLALFAIGLLGLGVAMRRRRSVR
jgi:PEP-CTERM motif